MRRRSGVIWDSDYDEDELIAALKEDYADDYPEEMDNDSFWEDFAYEYNRDRLGDERMNLDIALNNEIVIIAMLGRWNGRFHAIKRLHTNNIKDILHSHNDGDIIKFYSDGYNICAREADHDGTSFYTFRVMRDGMDADDLVAKFLCQKEVTKNTIKYYTKSIVEPVSKVYGW